MELAYKTTLISDFKVIFCIWKQIYAQLNIAIYRILLMPFFVTKQKLYRPLILLITNIENDMAI